MSTAITLGQYFFETGLADHSCLGQELFEAIQEIFAILVGSKYFATFYTACQTHNEETDSQEGG